MLMEDTGRYPDDKTQLYSLLQKELAALVRE